MSQPNPAVPQMPEGTVARSSLGFIFLRTEDGYRVLEPTHSPDEVKPDGAKFDRDVAKGGLQVIYLPGHTTTVTPAPKEA